MFVSISFKSAGIASSKESWSGISFGVLADAEEAPASPSPPSAPPSATAECTRHPGSSSRLMLSRQSISAADLVTPGARPLANPRADIDLGLPMRKDLITTTGAAPPR